MSSETRSIVDAAIVWVQSIKDHPFLWADREELYLIMAVERYLDEDKWGLFKNE